MHPLLDMPDVALRQQLPPAYVLNGALYLASRSLLEREKAFLTSHTLGYEMPLEWSVDIDTSLDWQYNFCFVLNCVKALLSSRQVCFQITNGKNQSSR